MLYCSQFPLYRDFHSTRSIRVGELPPVSLPSWIRGGLVNDTRARHVMIHVFLGNYQVPRQHCDKGHLDSVASLVG